jgi:thioredoxin-like negative regulator of GroEL
MYHTRMVGALLTMLATSLAEGSLITITDEDHYAQELKNHDRLLIKFSADWCTVCNSIKKPFEEIANEAEFAPIAFAQVDVDKLDGISKQNGIVGVPTFVYVEKGNKKVEEIGVQNMPAFKEHVRDNLRKTFQLAPNAAAASAMTESQNNSDTAVQTTSDATTSTPANFMMAIVQKIMSVLKFIVAVIKKFFTTIIDAIKGLFIA